MRKEVIMIVNKDYDTIVTDGLVLNLDAGFLASFPATGSSWYDLGPSQSNGALENGTQFDTVVGGSILFDGLDDYVALSKTIDISNSNNNGNYTIFLDFTLPGPITLQNRRAFFSSPEGRQFEFSTTSGMLIAMVIDGQSGHQNVFMGTTLQLNVPQSVVITKTQTNIFTIWVNGLLTRTQTPPYLAFRVDVGSDNYPVTTSTVFDTSIRNFSAISGRRWNGRLFKTLIYNRVLSQSEILQNYYNGPIITDGLTFSIDASSFISYDRIGATWSNMVGTTVNGTLTNSPTFNLLYGGGFKFDGTNQFVTYGNHTPYGFTSGVFSVCVWVNIPSGWTAGSQYPNLISKGASAGWDTNGWAVFAFRNHGSGNSFTLGYGMRNSTTTNTGAQIGNIPTDRPVHFCVTLDGSNIRAYLDGTVRTTISQTITPASNTDSFIIARGPSTGHFPGTVYMSQIYTRSLSPSEVLQNFNAHKSRYVF